MTSFREWRAHILERLARQVEAAADAGLVDLLEELKGYPVPPGAKPYRPAADDALGGMAVPRVLTTNAPPLRFLNTTRASGTGPDFTLADSTIEPFFPPDPEPATAMWGLWRPG